VPWKGLSNTEATIKQLHDTAEKVQAAKHIVIAGAGPTGCETSSEIKYQYGANKNVVLLSADAELMGGDSIGSNMEYEMKKLGVDVRKNSRVEGSKVLPGGKTEVTLEDGTTITTDLYLPTMGLRPNTGFLDAKHLNERKYAEVDEFYQVKNAENVWACGDIVSKPRAGFMIADKQVSFPLGPSPALTK
jgi:NADPH-dependent 2,4-dienoyl-CoA reductase/sulfur reductase-like enzyme